MAGCCDLFWLCQFLLLQVCTLCHSSKLPIKVSCRALINRVQPPNVSSCSVLHFPIAWEAEISLEASMGKGEKEEFLCIPRSWVATAWVKLSCMSFTGDHPV